MKLKAVVNMHAFSVVLVSFHVLVHAQLFQLCVLVLYHALVMILLVLLRKRGPKIPSCSEKAEDCVRTH